MDRTGRLLRLLAVGCVLAGIEGREEAAGGLRLLYSTYRQCEDSGQTLLCLKTRALRLVDRALHINTIPLVDGVTLVSGGSEGGRALEALEPLPAEMDDATADRLLADRTLAFLTSRSLQLKLPSFLDAQDDTTQEGRGKRKKIMPAILLALMLKGSMLAMAMKALALLAGKALVISKMALVLAGVIALKKLFSGNHEKTTYEIVKQPIVSHSHQYSTSHEYADGGFEHGGYGRSLDAHDLAYGGQPNANPGQPDANLVQPDANTS